MMVDEVSDEALMLRYQRGDGSAFGALVRRHEVAVYNFVLRELGSSLAAADLSQEVFLGVARDAGRFDPETRFSTHLFSRACQLVREHRVHGARPAQPGLDPPPPADSIEGSIAAAVAGLPELEKDVYLLREVAGLSFSEISRVTGRSEAAVKSQMQHALQRLRRALQGFEEYERALR